MSIRAQYDRTASTKRLAVVTGSKRTTWQTNVTTFDCVIMPVDGAHNELADGSYYQLFKLFCDATVDVKVGDRVLSGSDTYTVRAVDVYNFGRSTANHHTRVMLAKGV